MGLIAAAAVGVAAAGASMAYGASQGEDVYGAKPVVPPYPDLDKIQGDAIGANVKNFDSIKDIVAKTNKFNADQYMKTLEQLYPGYGNLSKLSRDEIISELGGKIPKGLSEEVSRNAAERGIAGGFGADSQFGRNLEARDLGLTSYQITQQGLNSAARWMAQAASATPSPMRAEGMFISPAQSLQYTRDKFSRDWLEAQVRAAPDPTAVGQYQAIQTGIGQLGSSVGGLVGGIAGGGGGMFGGSYSGGFGGGGGGFNMGQWAQSYGAINNGIGGSGYRYGGGGNFDSEMNMGIPGY